MEITDGGGGGGDAGAVVAAAASVLNPDDVPDLLNPEIEETVGKSTCKIRYPELVKMEKSDIAEFDILEQPEDGIYFLVFTVTRPDSSKILYRHKTRGIPVENEVEIKSKKMDKKRRVFEVTLTKTIKRKDFALKPFFLPESPPPTSSVVL